MIKCVSGSILRVSLTSGSSVPGNLFGGGDNDGNNLEVVKWPMPLQLAINILSYCRKMEFVLNLGMELCEDIQTLQCVRSTFGRSVPVILFGGGDDDATVPFITVLEI